MAVEKLSDKLVDKLTRGFQHFRGNMAYSPPVGALISTADSRYPLAQEKVYRRYTPQVHTWFYQKDHEEDMRKWDEQSTMILDTQVQE